METPSKVIFEKGDYFAIEVLLLHSKFLSPSISSVGKIAGIDKITVLTRPLSGEEVSLIKELFPGNAPIQVMRAAIYFIGSLFASIAIILVLIGATNVVIKLRIWRRRKRILQTKTAREMDDEEIRNLIIEHYESRGVVGLRWLQGLTHEPERLMWIGTSSKWLLREHSDITHLINADTFHEIDLEYFHSSDVLRVLTEKGVLRKGENDNAVIDSKFVETIDNLLAELEN